MCKSGRQRSIGRNLLCMAYSAEFYNMMKYVQNREYTRPVVDSFKCTILASLPIRWCYMPSSNSPSLLNHILVFPDFEFR